MGNITSIPEVEKDEILATIIAAKRLLPHMEELNFLDAQYKWSKYQAFLKQGFNEIQSLELCK